MDINQNPDRRTGKRSLHSGMIEITFEDPRPTTIQGDLIEINDRGFRVAHDENALKPGLEVYYRRSNSSGQARVMWTQVLENRCVSGFLILPIDY